MPLKADPTHPSVSGLFRLAVLLLIIATLSGCAAAVVGGVAATVHDRRSAGTILDDNAIELHATDRLHQDGAPGRGNHIRVVSYNRTVLLAGEVRTEEAKQEAERIVSQVGDVQRVVNELAIGEQTGLGRRSRDTLLTGQIKAALLGTGLPGFDPARVKVTSLRGIAYLMGLVTEEEAEKVAERVARVRGVKQVVKVFDYIPESGL
ncbi:MAG: BON domain-containing protein [Xanthomonadales bacterium]|nr:BON domain-containing protein [Xanthomonadales bacterium]